MMAWSQDDKLELEKLYIQEMRPVLNRRALFSDTTGEYDRECHTGNEPV